jgi:hypothetical protein
VDLALKDAESILTGKAQNSKYEQINSSSGGRNHIDHHPAFDGANRMVFLATNSRQVKRASS